MNMRISILPKSSSGWWSAGLVIASLALFVLFEVILGPGPDYNMALADALTIIIAGISAAVFATGLLGIIKSKERSVLVFAAMVVGVYSLFGCITGLLGLQK
jgi:hypothetical protein